jgi:hypothetical protein
MMAIVMNNIEKK